MRYRNDTYAEDVWDVYWYKKNLEGDILGVYNSTGTKLVSYTYDPWGKVYIRYISGGASTSAAKNSLMYRGYYYDKEIGLYYLQSRYYDASVSRFINADDAEVTTHSNRQQNSFTYCANNGIVAYDTLGYFPVHLVVGTVAGFIWGIAPRLLKMILFKQRAKLSDVLCDGLAGAVGGLITAATGNSTLEHS